MGFFDFLKPFDINQGVKEYAATPGAVLIDVRTPQEYRDGHIPKSRNISLSGIEKAKEIIRKKDTPIFVYCYSGSRSRQAAHQLEKMGFTVVKNIGGFAGYSGKVER